MSIGKIAALGIEAQLQNDRLGGKTPEDLANLMKNVPPAIEQVVTEDKGSLAQQIEAELGTPVEFEPLVKMPEGDAAVLTADASGKRYYTPEEEKKINEKWEKMSLEDVHKENIRIIKKILDPINTAYRQLPGERSRKRAELTQALRDFAKEIHLDRDITGLNATEIAIAMLTEYYELFNESTAKKGKEEIRMFLSRDIIRIVKPYLK